jgi:hypothetical protein
MVILDGVSNHSVVNMQFGDVRLDRFEKPQPTTSDPVASGQDDECHAGCQWPDLAICPPHCTGQPCIVVM